MWFNCGRQEEPSNLISMLLLRMRRMYVASIRLAFHHFLLVIALLFNLNVAVRSNLAFFRKKGRPQWPILEGGGGRGGWRRWT